MPAPRKITTIIHIIQAYHDLCITRYIEQSRERMLPLNREIDRIPKTEEAEDHFGVYAMSSPEQKFSELRL